MEEKQQWEYQKNCLLGAVGAALLIIGDLCLSMVSANKADSGLYMRDPKILNNHLTSFY